MSPQPLSLVHRLRPPTQPLSTPPPLLLLLHGVGSNESDLMGLAPYLDKRFFIISARGPLTLGPGAYGWYHLQFTPEGLLHDPDEAAAGRRAAARFIDEVINAYGLDRDRVYLMGFSQGAIISLGITLTEPERIAGTVVMSGRLLPELVSQIAGEDKLAGVPLFVAHGTDDSVLPIHFGREIRDVLADLPVALTYREYPMAHEVNEDSLHDIAVWLTKQLNAPSRRVY